ncbi:MAG: MATE family efflux transporter [Rhodospirillales bacterium]
MAWRDDPWEVFVKTAAASWNRRVWRMAGPIILSSISVPILGAVDTAVVGQLPGAEQIAAVGAGTTIFNVLFQTLLFLRMGTLGLTAQAVGANDGDEIRAALARPSGLALVIGFGLIVLQVPLAWIAFNAIGASPGVTDLARDYFAVRIWVAPAFLCNLALVGWFIGIQRPRVVLALQVVINGINVGLDLWFVLGLGWGVTGVAWASLTAQYVGLGLGLMVAHNRLRHVAGFWRLELLRRAEPLKRMLNINSDIFMRTLCLAGCMAVITAIGARSGDLVLATNTIMLSLTFVASYGLDGFAHAVSALAGTAAGARDRRQFRLAVRYCGGWAVGVAGFMSGIYLVTGPAIIDLMTEDGAVRALCREYLPWVIAGPFYSVWCFLLDGIFVGATRARDMRNMAFLSALAFIASATIFVPLMGNHGLWLSYVVFMLTRAVTLGSRYPALERSISAPKSI